MDAKALYHMGWLKFEPVQPVRPGFLGEVVYNEHWQALMRRELDGHSDYYADTPNAMLAEILSAMPLGINQREATVATSFIVWLGTACGRGLLFSARDKADHFRVCLSTGYSIAWHLQNQRQIGQDGGYRTIEFLLAPPDARTYRSLNWGCDMLSDAPQLSVTDYETCEHVATWLGTDLGAAFVTECEREIDLRRYARPPRTDGRSLLPREVAA